jgi:aspartyl-tRNA(Asn)/glutamyl-tRNA(Gln) amidotransferase subunit B
MKFETVIGLEIHAQLSTRSKMFCGCSTDYANSPPNTHVCPICLGMPGVLPKANHKAIEYTVMTALALNCRIPDRTKFDRKNYSYPDLMKGYQISQYDAPIGVGGWMDIEDKRIGIERVHLEEDVAKLIHKGSCTLVDVNRSGIPLMEVVTRPDISTPEEAREFVHRLRTILQYLGVSSGNMEEGSLRCDANISIRANGQGFPKVEVKNMNSLSGIYRALEYEERRQREAVEKGEKLVQETRGFSEEGVTFSQRSKEYASDYRYFPEPDIPPLALDRKWVEELRSCLPELPDSKKERLVKEVGLSPYQAELISSQKSLCDYFEACLAENKVKPAEIANWLLGEFSHQINQMSTDPKDCPVRPHMLCELIDLVASGKISGTSGQEVLGEMFQSGRGAEEIVQERELYQIIDEESVRGVACEVISQNQKAVQDFKKGKTQVLSFLVGQVMKKTQGRANPGLTANTLTELLK